MLDSGPSKVPEPLATIEINILNQLLDGYSIPEIAANTGYSDLLVASALTSIQSKTGSKNLVQATVKLIQSGILEI